MPKVAPPFWDRLARDGNDGCWCWTGATDRNGYGSVWWEGKSRPSHLLAYALAHGPLPVGSSVAQTCGVHGCCRPDHLVEVPPLRRPPDPPPPTATGPPASSGDGRARRSYGSGGLSQVKPNVWELRVATGGPNRFTGKYGEISRTSHGTKLQAELELDRLRDAARSARNRAVPNATAADLFDAYLEWLARQVKLGSKSPNTLYKSYEPKIRKHLRPQLGHYRLRKLEDGSVINELYEAMLNEDWIDGQVSRANSRVSIGCSPRCSPGASNRDGSDRTRTRGGLSIRLRCHAPSPSRARQTRPSCFLRRRLVLEGPTWSGSSPWALLAACALASAVRSGGATSIGRPVGSQCRSPSPTSLATGARRRTQRTTETAMSTSIPSLWTSCVTKSRTWQGGAWLEERPWSPTITCGPTPSTDQLRSCQRLSGSTSSVYGNE